MRKMNLSRRQLLRGLGVSSAAAMLPMLDSLRARAQEADIPQRIIFLYGGSGSLPGDWEPTARSETDFDLNDLHEPLSAYKSDLVLFENLDMVSKLYDPTPPMNAHMDGATHALTGANRATGVLPGAVSIDQFIAQSIAAPTRLPSLELVGASWIPSGDGNNAIASGPGAMVPQMFDMAAAYDRMFPPQTEEGQTLAEERTRVYDYVHAEFDALSDRVSSEDRAKVEQHFAAVDDLQVRLNRALRNDPPPPTLVDPYRNLTLSWPPSPEAQGETWETTSDLAIRLAVAALHSDVTRVVNVELQDAPGALFGYTVGQYDSDSEHDLTHKVNNPMFSQSKDPAAREAIRSQHLRTSEKVGLLLDLLAERTETDGQRLLDHTIVVWCSQIADGSHALTRLPWLVAGGGGSLNTGRYLRFERGTVDGKEDVGQPHNDLFVSLAQAMGIEIDTFGNADVCRGALPGLLA